MERWEQVLRGERSFRYSTAVAAARLPGVRSLRRLLDHLAMGGGVTLEEREAAVARLERREDGARGTLEVGDGGAYRPVPAQDRPEGLPPIGPALSNEIDRALELLRQIPFEEIQRRGWHFQPNHFYWPLNDLRFLRANPDLWLPARMPADIRWDLEAQEDLLRRLAGYAAELDDVPDDPPVPISFAWKNPTLPKADAFAYYGLVRELQPKRVVEIGSGWSTLLLVKALARNPGQADVTLIEPMPPPWLERNIPPDWRFERTILQRAPMDVFEQLGEGDILFYDGSHCVSTASDVNWFFFEVLPRVPKGVWVHVHDILWPHERVGDILDEGLTWNEQYLLQAFLMGNRQYEVRLAINMLLVLRADRLAEFAPGPEFHGGSVWFEKVA
jgi:hypothetical protein